MKVLKNFVKYGWYALNWTCILLACLTVWGAGTGAIKLNEEWYKEHGLLR